jgi:DNA-binding response OmpR family regulator
MRHARKDRVLLIDSHPEELKQNSDYLRENGYEVDTASTVQQGIRLLEQYGSSCVVMDTVFPEMDNFEGFALIHSCTGAPILFLTERGRQDDRIRGLSMGAQDYIVKPCSPQELSLRIMIHMCRQQTPSPDSGILRFPPLSIELMNRRVFYDGAQIVLSKREFDLLVILAKNSGEVVTFEQIGQELYGTYLESDRKNIMVLASRLRKKLGGEDVRGFRIETVWGTGYKFFQK